LIVLFAWFGAGSAFSESPATATAALVLAGLLVVPPPAWGMGGRRGGTVTTVRNFYRDHLGSAAYITGPNVRQAYEPFGKPILTGTGTDDEFTSKEYHGATEMYYFGARWYDADAGRFAGVDPLVTQPENPQQLNAYGYVLNDPVNLTDPSGMCVRPNAACGISTTVGVRYTITPPGGGRPTYYDGDNLGGHLAALNAQNQSVGSVAIYDLDPVGGKSTGSSKSESEGGSGSECCDGSAGGDSASPDSTNAIDLPAEPAFVNASGIGNLVVVNADQALKIEAVNYNALPVQVGITVDRDPPLINGKSGELGAFGSVLPPGGSVTRTFSILNEHPQSFRVRIDVSKLEVKVFFYTNHDLRPQGHRIGPR
jgi:RHS repeat-associated protein